MQAGGPPRFVPTLTEVVHDASDDAPMHGDGAAPGMSGARQAGDAHAAAGAHPDPSLAAWQAALAQALDEALVRVLAGCPPPPGASTAQVSQALQAALAQSAQVRHPRN